MASSGPSAASTSRAGDRFFDPRPFPDAPPSFAVRALLALRRKLLRLADSILPADVVLFERATHVLETVTIGLAAKLGVSDLLAQHGPLTGAQLAERLHTNADCTHRFLRALATRGIYELASDGRYSNNALSRALLSGTPMRGREWARYMCSHSNLKAAMQLEHVVTNGGSAFEHANGMGVWAWFDAHPDEREHFAHAMMGLTFVDAPLIASLYPFRELHTLCDVGGGRGSLLSELLLRHPHLRGTLCDADGVVESARSLLRARGVLDRVELHPANFFEAVPAGADAYLLKNILHDWDDARSELILGCVRRAIPAHGRLLVVEMLCEPNLAEGIAPLSDLQMMLVCDGGRERSREEFATLFAKCGFELKRVFPSPTTSVLEAVPS